MRTDKLQNIKLGDSVIIRIGDTGSYILGIVLKLYPHNYSSHQSCCEMFIRVTDWGPMSEELKRTYKKTWRKYDTMGTGYYVTNNDSVVGVYPCKVSIYTTEGFYSKEKCYTYSENNEVSVKVINKWNNSSVTIVRKIPNFSYVVVERKICDRQGNCKRESVSVKIGSSLDPESIDTLTKLAYKDAEKKLIDLLEV